MTWLVSLPICEKLLTRRIFSIYTINRAVAVYLDFIYHVISRYTARVLVIMLNFPTLSHPVYTYKALRFSKHIDYTVNANC